VVNGGISVWTLLNQYERSKYLGENLDSFADVRIFGQKLESKGGETKGEQKK
jgi:hypothetical protein